MTREERLQKRRDEYHANKGRHLAKMKIYRDSHKEEIAARGRAYRAKNAIKIAAKKHDYARLNPECNRKASAEYRARNRKVCSERIADWKKRHADLVRLQKRQQERKRRAILQGCRVDRVDYSAIYERDRGVCHLCGEIPEKYHFDHVIPLSKGGPHVAENIKVACAFCNMSKGDRIAA